MNLLIIQPKTWGDHTALAFAEWMKKIKSNHYADNERMDLAFQKFNKYQ